MLKYYNNYYDMLKIKEKEHDEMNEKKNTMQERREKEEAEAATPHLGGGVQRGIEAALDDE